MTIIYSANININFCPSVTYMSNWSWCYACVCVFMDDRINKYTDIIKINERFDGWWKWNQAHQFMWWNNNDDLGVMIDDNEFSLSHVTRQFRILVMAHIYISTGNTLCVNSSTMIKQFLQLNNVALVAITTRGFMEHSYKCCHRW